MKIRWIWPKDERGFGGSEIVAAVLDLKRNVVTVSLGYFWADQIPDDSQEASGYAYGETFDVAITSDDWTQILNLALARAAVQGRVPSDPNLTQKVIF